MSYFYGIVVGSAKNPVTRQGTKNSGIKSHVSTWNYGIETKMYYNQDKETVVEVYKTGGSNDRLRKTLIHREIIRELKDEHSKF